MVLILLVLIGLAMVFRGHRRGNASVRRTVFEALGGFPDLPLTEDVALSNLLKRQGRVACLRSQVITSARRWERGGVWGTVLKMWAFRLFSLVGVSPMRLKRFYGDAR